MGRRRSGTRRWPRTGWENVPVRRRCSTSTATYGAITDLRPHVARIPEIGTQRIAILSYHKFAGPDWPVEEFQACEVKLAGGETVGMLLAERATVLSNGLQVRETRKRSEGGHQVAILSTNQVLDKERL